MSTNTATPSETALLQPGELIDERELAGILACEVGTLRNWRALKNKGPRFVKIGERMVRYRRSDVEAFIAGIATAKAA